MKPFYWWQIQIDGRYSGILSFKKLINEIPQLDKRYYTIWTHDLEANKKWYQVYEHIPSDECSCGRPYEKFKFRDALGMRPRTIPEQIAWLQLPILCKFCYYRNAYNRGDWCPKAVLKEMGIEVPNNI